MTILVAAYSLSLPANRLLLGGLSNGPWLALHMEPIVAER